MHIPRGQVWLGDSTTQYFEQVPKIIWSFWNSEEIPLIVKACYASWRLHNPDYEIRMLTPKSVLRYLSEVPVNLFSETPQRQSDYIRLALIAQYGGIWVDATVISFRSMDYVNLIMESSKSQFVGYYNGSHTTTHAYPLIENWFLAAPPRSQFVVDWLKEFTYSIVNGAGPYIKAVGKRYKIEELQQGLHTPYYFSCHIAVQVILRKRNEYRINLLQAEQDAFRLLRRQSWNIEKIKVLFLTDPAPVEQLDINITKLIGKVWRPLEEAIQAGEVKDGSALGNLLDLRNIA